MAACEFKQKLRESRLETSDDDDDDGDGRTVSQADRYIRYMCDIYLRVCVCVGHGILCLSVGRQQRTLK